MSMHTTQQSLTHRFDNNYSTSHRPTMYTANPTHWKNHQDETLGLNPTGTPEVAYV